MSSQDKNILTGGDKVKSVKLNIIDALIGLGWLILLE